MLGKQLERHQGHWGGAELLGIRARAAGAIVPLLSPLSTELTGKHQISVFTNLANTVHLALVIL